MIKNKKFFLPVFSFLFILVISIGCSQGEISNDKEGESDWPNNEIIDLVVPYGTGGATDGGVRLFQPFLEEALGTSVVVKNSPGAGSELGSTEVYNAEGDGSTILVSAQPDLNLTIARGAPYTNDDFAPLVIESKESRILMVEKDSPYNTLEDFIEATIKDPDSISVSVTQGSGHELFGEWLKHELEDLGGSFRIAGYDSGGEQSNALVGGHVDATIGDDHGRYNLRDDAKVLAIASDEPSFRWPEAETFEKQLEKYDIEMPDVNLLARNSMYAVTSEVKENYPERYEILQNAFLEAAENPEYLKAIDEQGKKDLLIWKKGEEYEEEFKEELQSIKDIIELIK